MERDGGCGPASAAGKIAGGAKQYLGLQKEFRIFVFSHFLCLFSFM